MNAGKLIQIIRPVVDAEFAEEVTLPKIYDAPGSRFRIMEAGGRVHQHLGGGRVRAVAMGSTGRTEAGKWK